MTSWSPSLFKTQTERPPRLMLFWPHISAKMSLGFCTLKKITMYV